MVNLAMIVVFRCFSRGKYYKVHSHSTQYKYKWNFIYLLIYFFLGLSVVSGRTSRFFYKIELCKYTRWMYMYVVIENFSRNNPPPTRYVY